MLRWNRGIPIAAKVAVIVLAILLSIRVVFFLSNPVASLVTSLCVVVWSLYVLQLGRSRRLVHADTGVRNDGERA